MRDDAAINNRGASMKDAVKMLFIGASLTAIPFATASVALLSASAAYEPPGSLETVSFRAKDNLELRRLSGAANKTMKMS